MYRRLIGKDRKDLQQLEECLKQTQEVLNKKTTTTQTQTDLISNSPDQPDNNNKDHSQDSKPSQEEKDKDISRPEAQGPTLDIGKPLTDLNDLLDGEFQAVSINLRKKPDNKAVMINTEVLLMQEAEYFNGARLPAGSMTLSEKNHLRIWSKSDQQVLKNKYHLQIVEVKIKQMKTIIFNVHLSSNPTKRQEQLTEIQTDIDQIITSTKSQNIIIGGDFNLRHNAIKIDKLIRVNNNDNTWRRNDVEFTSLIDHYYVSAHIKGIQTNIITESDHKAMLLQVEGLHRHKGMYLPKVNSALSKNKTKKADIKNTEVYPHIHIHNY
jgi:exonuclease III